MEIRIIFDESWQILDQAAGDLTRHNRAMPHLGNSDREAKPLQVDLSLIEEDRRFGLLS